MDSQFIGNKIAKARKEKNMSQAKLAQLLFISPQAVGKWERGESMPDITTLDRLADILAVDLNYFSESALPVNKGTAATMAIDNTGDDEQTAQRAAHVFPLSGRKIHIDLNATDLQESDFAGVVLHKGKFKNSQLRKANFAGADLTGSTFDVIDAREAVFDNADLTDCGFSATDLTNASFRKSILIRTHFNMSGQSARFIDVNLLGVKLIKTDLRQTTFENCTFTDVDLSYCDLRGMCFEGLTFTGVRFDRSALNEVSFKGATLRNVSFTVPFSVTNRSYRAIKTICFDGANMDKLTYAALKGLRVADLAKVVMA